MRCFTPHPQTHIHTLLQMRAGKVFAPRTSSMLFLPRIISFSIRTSTRSQFACACRGWLRESIEYVYIKRYNTTCVCVFILWYSIYYLYYFNALTNNILRQLVCNINLWCSHYSPKQDFIFFVDSIFIFTLQVNKSFRFFYMKF